MRPASSLLISCVGALGVAPSCGAAEKPVRTSIVTSLSVPRSLLDRARALDLRVLEGQVDCDETRGATIAVEGASREVARRSLDGTGCPSRVKFCGTLTIEKSTTPRVFEATARDASGEVLATGCATATIVTDAATVDIRMFRHIAPAVCGDGTIQPTEQCEPGGTDTCDDACQSKEILLSIGAPENKTSSGKAGDKTDPFFLWPPGSGEAGRFVAFYTDRAVPSGGGTLDVGLRVMSADLSPLSSPPALASGSIFLANGSGFPPSPEPRQQSRPQATVLGDTYYVVFQSDNAPSLDIHMRALDRLFAEQGPLVEINGGEANVQQAPTIAASADRLFVAWEDQAQGKIVGRTVTPSAGTYTLGNPNDISTGTGNVGPQVASTGDGWVVVWTSGTGIKLRAINADGTPSGTELTVDESGAGAEGARVAALPDGRFAVVWSAGGDVFVQRYDAKGQPISGDQARPVNDVVTAGEQTQPAIAATPAAGGSYVVAWLDADTGHVRARFLGGSSGFLFNNVDGQATEFQASREDGRTRAQPVVASGGSGPFVAIGWEDRSASGAGIVVRRFPLPSD
jgi:hypothetical protein